MILWLNPVAGLSGDMLLGALLDLGAPADAVRAAVASTGLTGWNLQVSTVRRGGLRATRALVEVTDSVTERAAADLLALVERAVPAPVATLAATAVRALARVEADIHGVTEQAVHLHELGGIDTVVDTVGVAAALHALGITEVVSSPLRLGSGTIASAHGVIPVPAPATLALLADAAVIGIAAASETVTPTGAALLLAAGCRYEPMPALRVKGVGYGAGGRDPADYPNVLPAVLGLPLADWPAARAADDLDSAPAHAGLTGAVTEELTMLETTVDDVAGEILGALIAQLLAAGALDAWLTPAIGKKNRPAQVLSALCPSAAVESVSVVMLAETGSLGLRRSSVSRTALPRRTSEVQVRGLPVRIKSGPYRDKPEHDDVAAVAAATGLPLRVVAELALAELARQSS